MSEPDHRALNLSNWESRVPHHVAGYGIDRLLARPAACLSFVVAFDRDRLGDVARPSTCCICSATSGPTRSRWPGWAPA